MRRLWSAFGVSVVLVSFAACPGDRPAVDGTPGPEARSEGRFEVVATIQGLNPGQEPPTLLPQPDLPTLETPVAPEGVMSRPQHPGSFTVELSTTTDLLEAECGLSAGDEAEVYWTTETDTDENRIGVDGTFREEGTVDQELTIMGELYIQLDRQAGQIDRCLLVADIVTHSPGIGDGTPAPRPEPEPDVTPVPDTSPMPHPGPGGVGD